MSTSTPKDKETKGVQDSNDPKCIEDDAPPSLETLPSVVWDQALSFLPPADISSVSHRISKTFGAAGGDRADAPERAAKLALEHMMKKARNVASCPNFGPKGLCVLCNESSGGSDPFKVSRFSEESYLRTYHLAMVMLRAGNTKRDVLFVRFQKNLDGERKFLHTWPIFILMWLLYGNPAIGTVTSRYLMTIATDMANRMNLYLSPDTIDREDGKMEFMDGREQRKATHHKLAMHCRSRILQMADRFRKFGLINEASNLLHLLSYDRPHVLNHVMQADFYVGSTVVLQNLKKAELNGSVGSVEKAFDPSTGRVGVEIGGEEEGDRRMVSIKPANVLSLEDDPNLTIDAKILQGQLLCDFTRTDFRFNPPWMPVSIHNLRGVVPKLRAKVAASRDVSLDSKVEAHEGQVEVSSLFSSDHLQLFRAELSLANLLSLAAGSIGMGFVPPSFGGLDCGEAYFDEAQIELDGDEAVRCKKWHAARFLLKEAKDVLDSCTDITAGHSPDLELAREKDWVEAKIRFCAGFMTEFIGLPILPISPITEVNEDNIIRTSRENFLVSASIFSTHFERMLLDASEQCGGMLTVKRIIVNSNLSHHFVRNLFNFAEQMALVYGTGLISFGGPGEGEDHLEYLKFALAVSFGYFGQEHHMTLALLAMLQRTRMLPEVDDSSVQFSIDQVDKWLENYTPRYLGTPREHPSLFEELSGEVFAAP